MPEISRKDLEQGDMVRIKDEPGCDCSTEVEIEGFSKDKKRIAVEKKHYSSCTGHLVGGTSFGVEVSSVLEVLRWVKVTDGETQDEIIERQRKRIDELEDKIDSLEGDIDKVADAALRGR
jgi:hypothetical protein